ncbi:MAG: VWA domain-containing protein [Burkholderiales bacterium]|nr:VWA domain-containing protein [Burkholderiales bacterium]
MKFLWPQFLWLFLLLPLLVAWYVAVLRRKRRGTLAYSNLALVRAALTGGATWRRHVPALILLLAVGSLIAALARPVAVLSLPTQHETVILAMDVSGSMRATDVKPSRLVAAQEAAKAFIADQPRHVRVGIVSFAATAQIVQYPTQNRQDAIDAIDRFSLQRGTALGSGIVLSLAALFPDAGIDVTSFVFGGDPFRNSPWRVPKKEAKPVEAVPPGSYTNGAIILLTDGERTTGPDPVAATKMAADRGVRIFTVGVGTPKGETIGFEGWSMRVKLDEATLKQIADTTRGDYYFAGNAVDLKKVYEKLSSRLVFEKKETEIGALFAAVGALLAVLAGLLSLYWFNRIL